MTRYCYRHCGDAARNGMRCHQNTMADTMRLQTGARCCRAQVCLALLCFWAYQEAHVVTATWHKFVFVSSRLMPQPFPGHVIDHINRNGLYNSLNPAAATRCKMQWRAGMRSIASFLVISGDSCYDGKRQRLVVLSSRLMPQPFPGHIMINSTGMGCIAITVDH